MGISVTELNDSLNPPKNDDQPTEDGEFSTGLFDCSDDVSLCCLTCWCPCITFGRMAEIVDQGSSSCGINGAVYSSLFMFFTGFQCLYSCTYRSKMKTQLGISKNYCEDCCTHFWCETCALCQEYRELQHRGYDVSLGWHRNMEKQNPGIVVPPSLDGMTRLTDDNA